MKSMKNKGESVGVAAKPQMKKPTYIGAIALTLVILIVSGVFITSNTDKADETAISRVTSREVAQVYEELNLDRLSKPESKSVETPENGVKTDDAEVKPTEKEVITEDVNKKIVESGATGGNLKGASEEQIKKQVEVQTKAVPSPAPAVVNETENNAVAPTTNSVDTTSGGGVVTYTGDGSQGKFKAYMDKDAITAKSSPQYKLKEQATIDSNGIACVDGRMLIAVGTGHNAPVGTNLDVTLTDGTVLKCKVGDIKQNRHTDASNKVCTGNGSIIEFLVETSCMNTKAKQMGDISYAGYFGGITKIVRVG